MPDERRRSRSPRLHSGRKRSKSADHSDRREHRHSDRRRNRSPRGRPVDLPYGARLLSKNDLRDWRPLFGLYLDVQKQIEIEDLSNDEAKGRWKSFIGKWNRGDLSEGWYDPQTKHRADKAATTATVIPQAREHTKSPSRKDAMVPRETEEEVNDHDEDDHDEDDEYGPAMAMQQLSSGPIGPRIPSMQDIQYRNELALEDKESLRDDCRYARKLDRKAQKESLDELVPRAEPGTRERQLEKKRETAAANRSFREARSPGAEDIKEGDLMGEDGAEGVKAHIKQLERKKTERELRKEEALRAKMAEREERLAEHRAKENKTMDMLKALAKQNFGQGSA